MQEIPKNRIKFKYRQYHYLAIELRYRGKTYKEIAEELSKEFQTRFRPDRIGHWFAANGILESTYIDYAQKENERLRRFISEELKKLIPRIPRKMEEIFQRKDEFGQPKIDATTLGAVKLLCELLNLKAYMNPDPNPVNDILDEYFARLQQPNLSTSKGSAI